LCNLAPFVVNFTTKFTKKGTKQHKELTGKIQFRLDLIITLLIQPQTEIYPAL